MGEGTVTIVGVGLIGGSIGLALRARGLADRVIGVGRDPARLAHAQRLGAIDEAAEDAVEAYSQSDLVVVCTPVSRIVDDVCRAAAHARPGCLITDAGSTKAAIVAGVEADPAARAAFVGAHPIAGSEASGVDHAHPSLFAGSVCVLTPTEHTDLRMVERARGFWSGLGCRVAALSPQAHDIALAKTSHLPHVAASALARAATPQVFPLAGGAFRDTTRVAAADGPLWASIFLANRAPLLAEVAQLQVALDEFRAGLERADRAALEQWWELGRRARLGYARSKSDARALDHPVAMEPDLQTP